jgi:DNA topoisomerase IA
VSVSQSPYTLVVCEKPDAARRIAYALGNSNFKERRGLSPVFSATDHRNDHFIVCSAIGHLYGLVDSNRNRSVYPVFDVKWAPIQKKSAIRYQQIIKSISLLSEKATRFVHACDYDQEGEVIGYNILQYACKNKYENSFRAKFSTLTDEEIRNSFDNLLKPSKGLAEAGRSRHIIDFIYGVNLSRALTQSFKVSNDGKRYRNLSIGRVQGPTLAFVVDREIEIRRQITEAVMINQNQQQQQQKVVGTCPICNKGILRIIRSRKTKKRFIGCSNYSSGMCKATAPLPQKGSILRGRSVFHASGHYLGPSMLQNIPGNSVSIRNVHQKSPDRA